MKPVLARKILVSFMFFILSFSTCLSARLPLTGMNAYELINGVNSFLIADNRNFLCTKPIFRNIVDDQKIFISYIDKKDIHQPINGTILIFESLSGETSGIAMSVKLGDKAKYYQYSMTLMAILFACGLSTDEATQFVESIKYVDETTLKGTIWNRTLNRYYTLISPPPTNDINTFMLMAKDRI